MEKNIIEVPAGIRYISDWKEYDLNEYIEPHILNKQITGCGFTEYCLRNDMDVVLASPRRVLLENKEDQHEDVLYVRNDLETITNFDKDTNSTSAKGALTSVTVDQEKLREQVKKIKNQIKGYTLSMLAKGKPCKILVTYDSYRLVKEALVEAGIFNNFYTVVDEFQSIFVDSKFKSSTEIEFLGNLKGVQKVCYVSATPMMDKYLEMLDEFKDLPYYELDWKTQDPNRVLIPQLTVKPTAKLFNEIHRIIDSYFEGNFEKCSWKDEEGIIHEIESKEAVIYVNSVKNICDIISKCGLTIENTNVLCSKTPENEKKIRKAFGLRRNEPGGIGRVPKLGEPHKMFTLCTRTVYLGADFYSTNARSFIFSDANLDCLSVDITIDLPQILGRQRLDLNPWKNRAELYFRVLSKNKRLEKEDFEKLINLKLKKTENLLGVYNSTMSDEAKHDLAENFQKVAKMYNYKDDYVAVNEHAGSDLQPVKNNLVLISDIRTYEIQQIDYKDRFTVFNTLESNNLLSSNDELIYSKLREFEETSYFSDKLKLVCTTEFSEELQDKFLKLVPQVFENYYKVIGPEKCKALKYCNESIKSEYEKLLSNQGIDIKSELHKEFQVGLKYTKSDIKIMLGEIFKKCDYKETPKASELEKYFNIKPCLIANKETGKRDNGFLIISKKGEGL